MYVELAIAAVRVILALAFLAAGAIKLRRPDVLSRPFELINVSPALRRPLGQAVGASETAVALVCLFAPGPVVAATVTPLLALLALIAVLLYRRGVECPCGALFPRGTSLARVLVPRLVLMSASGCVWFDTGSRLIAATMTAVLVVSTGTAAARRMRARTVDEDVAGAAHRASRRAFLGGTLALLVSGFVVFPSTPARAAPCTLFGIIVPLTECAQYCWLFEWPLGQCPTGEKCCDLEFG